MVSMIANGEIDGRRLTDDEARGMCIMLYIGGLDSVTSGLGWYKRHLALDRELQVRLRRDPSLIPDAIEEFVRAYGTNSTMRTLTADTTFHGVAMKQGDIVVLPTFFASRDPREYAAPHRFDIARRARSMTFATGAHNCAGVHLAKREIRIVLEEFLSRFDNIRIPEGQSAVWTTQTIWGVKQLPLEWDKLSPG
jgi:cytochrome P450